MLLRNVDGRLQVTAGVALIERSTLMKWDGQEHAFVPNTRERFEDALPSTKDTVFGRLACWIHFSAGAEFLAKGVCLLNGFDLRHEACVPLYPQGDLSLWAPAFLADKSPAAGRKVTQFGTLGDLLYGNRRTKQPAFLKELCNKRATAQQASLVLAGFKLLHQGIRNRDAHAYVPHVRDFHFHLVPQLYADCFALLLKWVPGGPKRLTAWMNEAGVYVQKVKVGGKDGNCTM